MTLNDKETRTLDAFTNTALKTTQVKSDMVLAEIAGKCAAEGKENLVQSITNITLEIKTVLKTKSGSGNTTVYTFEISPYAVAKNGTNTVAEAELDQQALSISQNNTMTVKIPVLIEMLFATITHYPDENESGSPDTYEGIPVQEKDGERFAEVPIAHFSRFELKKGEAKAATVTPGTGTSNTATGAGGTTGSASASGTTGSAASLNSTPIPTPELTLAQKAALGMATIQENVAAAFLNLFGLNKNGAADTKTSDPAGQTADDIAAKTDAAADGTDGFPDENMDLTGDFRTAEAGEPAETVENAAEQESGSDANAAEQETDLKRQALTLKPGIILLIVLLIAVGAAFAICEIVLFKNKKPTKHKKKR